MPMQLKDMARREVPSQSMLWLQQQQRSKLCLGAQALAVLKG